MAENVRAALARFVLERQQEALVVLACDGRIVECNRRARGLDLDLAGLFDRRETGTQIATFVDELQLCGESETLVAGDGGAVYRLEGTAVDEWLIVVVRDVSAEQRADEELRRLRSQAALAESIASLIHDFNNLLTPILATSSSLGRELEQGSKAAGMASVIETSAMLAASLTRDLLSLTRSRTPMTERVDVNRAVVEIRSLLERLLTDVGELVLELDDGCGDALLDRRRLQHALINLVVNARDALVEPGRVTISSRVVERDGRSWISVCVADTGVGMSEEVRRRALDGFFTTKAGSGGLGLGLCSVARFARDSSGRVSIESEPMKGTSVRILLPREQPAESMPASTLDSRVSSRAEAILVAVRDGRVRSSIQFALEAEGHAVLLAQTAEAALELAADHPIEVALVDDCLLWPDAARFLRRLRARSPRVRLVFMSDVAERDWASDNVVTVLSKAFSNTDLLRAVRRAMAKSAIAS